jgi:hypothetical protein
MKPKAVKNSRSSKKKVAALETLTPGVQPPVATQAAPPTVDVVTTPKAPAGTLPKAGRTSEPARTQEQIITAVAAKIDVGFGNTLFIRGQGDGLSWEQGTPLHCVEASTWLWATTGAKDKVVFKLLLNDQVWAQGEDLTVEAGKRIEVVPSFQ